LVHFSKLEKLREIAFARGGSLLSDRYLGSAEKLRWQCRNSEHPPFGSTPSSVGSGHWCDRCDDDRRSESYKVSIEQVKKWAEERNGELILDPPDMVMDKRFALSDKAKFHCLLCDRHTTRTVRQIKQGRLCFCLTNKNRIDRFAVEKKLSARSIWLVEPDVISGGRTFATIQCKRCGERWSTKVSRILNAVVKCSKCNPSRNAAITVDRARRLGDGIGFQLRSDQLQSGNTALNWECKKCGARLDKSYREMRNIRRCRSCEKTEISARWKLG
jgi:hypothetical protein